MADSKSRSQVAVVILNWNGWRDTLECLTSLTLSSYSNFQVLLVDNGSTDDSLEMIRQWSREQVPVSVGPHKNKPKTLKIKLVELNQNEIDGDGVKDKYQNMNKNSIVLIKNDSNLGFAGGCNVGIRYAIQMGFDYIWLLNNDTALEKDCLEQLTDFLDQNPTFDVVTPKICYYDRPDTIWNCGGRLTFTGSRKYFYFNRKDGEKSSKGIRKITFITGCALFARTSVFQEFGLLTERFFFGEEDYEFSLRMKKKKVSMSVYFPARVYHKISSTKDFIFFDNQFSYAFVALLNRYVDLKSYYSKFYWHIWRLISLCYIMPMLKMKHHVPIKKLIRFSRLLLECSNSLESVRESELMFAREILS